jgi:hypothetical protein
VINSASVFLDRKSSSSLLSLARTSFGIESASLIVINWVTSDRSRCGMYPRLDHPSLVLNVLAAFVLSCCLSMGDLSAAR